MCWIGERMRLQRITIFSLVLHFALAFSPADAQTKKQTQVKIGSPAPSLAVAHLLQAPSEFHGTWDELHGRAVLLEFWATWCGGCVDSIAHLNELADKFSSQPIQFISITDETDVNFVSRFLNFHPIRGWVGFDSEERTFRNFGIEGRPRTVLIDQNGMVRAIANPDDITTRTIDSLLSGKGIDLQAPASPTLLGLESEAPSPLLQVLIRPAAPVAVSGFSPGAGFMQNGRFEIYGVSLCHILADAYHVPENRIDAPAWCETARYDVSVITPQNQENLRWPLLKESIEAGFQLKLHKEFKDTAVYVLKKIDGRSPILKEASSKGTGHSNPNGDLEAFGSPMSRLTQVVQEVLSKDVLDETGLTGIYDYHLKWDGKQSMSIVSALREQLGLELVEQQRQEEHLVVDSAQEPKTW